MRNFEFVRTYKRVQNVYIYKLCPCIECTVISEMNKTNHLIFSKYNGPVKLSRMKRFNVQILGFLF